MNLYPQQSVLNPRINIFQVYDEDSTRLIHQVTNQYFFLFIFQNYPMQCIEYTSHGCIKAYMNCKAFDAAYQNFYEL